jgi:HEAT repeat protein
MAQALAHTFDVLARSRNDAATAALLAALEAGDARVFDGSVRALVRRTSKQGHLAVLRRWHLLPEELKRAVDGHQGRMGGALRDGLLSPDDQLFANSCDVARESGEFDLAPTLITIAEQGAHQRSRVATELVVGLVGRLIHPLADDAEAGYSRHPETILKSVLESLERSVERFGVHGRHELVEAFIVLAGAGNAALRRILETTHNVCYETIVGVLEESANPDLLDVLADYLAKSDAPAAVRHVASRRVDGPFVARLLSLPLDPTNAALAKNLSRIRSFACLASVDAIGKRYSPGEQAAAMRLVSMTGAQEESKLDFAAALLARGSQSARVAACEALAPIAGQRSNDLVLAALADPDPHVQAAATRQLRDRHIPGSMAKLIELVASPHAEVQAAARESLSEFTFENYLARYETLDDDARRQTGGLVATVDVNAPQHLRQEMASLVRRRRLRAIEMADAMGLTARVSDALVERLSDEDHLVRAAAADALAGCSAFDVRDALLGALNDRSYAVQNAARNSLRALGFEVAAAGAADWQETR